MFPVEAFRCTLRKFKTLLSPYQIRFHLTGGVTGTAYGEPRMTQDIDVVIDPNQAESVLEQLVNSLRESEFLFDEPALRQAISACGMFQLLDRVESLKLDVYARELIPDELSRSELLELFEGESWPVVSRVDAAASKLVWISKGSHKSRRDLRAIVRGATAEQLQDLREVASQLELTELLDQVLGESDEFE